MKWSLLRCEQEYWKWSLFFSNYCMRRMRTYNVIYECLIIFMEFLLFSVLPPFRDNLLQGGEWGMGGNTWQVSLNIFCLTLKMKLFQTLTMFLLMIKTWFCLLFSRERQSYFMEWMTLFDWLGLLLVLCIIPLRYAGSKAQWTIASLAILFNFLRIFKFSSVTR